MSSLNKVMLIGNVGKDPEVTSLESGARVAKFPLATSERYTDKSGQKQERTDWHNIEVWGPTVDVVEKYVSKGKQIYVEGQIRTRSWEQDGVKKYAVDIRVTNLVLLGSGNGSKDSIQESQSQPQAQPQKAAAPAAKKTTSSAKSAAPAPAPVMNDTDEDLPF